MRCLLYTSIKIFAGTGYKLPDEVENEIEVYIDNDCAGIELKTGAEVGRVDVYKRQIYIYNDDEKQIVSIVGRILKKYGCLLYTSRCV